MLKSDSHDELIDMLNGPADTVWQSIADIWAAAGRIYAGPAGPDGCISPEYDLAQMVPTYLENAEAVLVNGLTNPNANVAAYCIVALHKLFDARSRFLPWEYAKIVESRTESLDVVFGCFGSHPTLADFARKYTDNYGLED